MFPSLHLRGGVRGGVVNVIVPVNVEILLHNHLHTVDHIDTSRNRYCTCLTSAQAALVNSHTVYGMDRHILVSTSHQCDVSIARDNSQINISLDFIDTICTTKFINIAECKAELGQLSSITCSCVVVVLLRL